MIIIADGGSTKTNWCLLDDTGKKIYFNTEGYNPYFVDSEYIRVWGNAYKRVGRYDGNYGLIEPQ